MDKLKQIDANNSYQIAADYFNLAFWEHDTLHFKEGSLAKTLYLIFTSGLYTSLLILVHWMYLILSILEPANRNDFPYEIWDATFTVVFTLEIFA